MERQILHIDMNNFFASVECLFRPELKKVPMAVAGDEDQRHGIVLAKNELAKACGVKTAEPLWEARRKCPEILFVPPHHGRYQKYSQAANRIYMEYTDQVEAFGIDESWLDVTGSRLLFGSGKEIAQQIRARIRSELGLTVSVGVSFNKAFAKLGSDYKKPDAVTVITPENFRQILWPLPAETLLFVGPSTKKTLQKYSIRTIGEVAGAGRDFLSRALGKGGESLWKTASGLDDSPVTSVFDVHEIKSIGNSTTTARDLLNADQVRTTLHELAEEVAQRLRKHGFWARGLQLWVRRNNFESYQRSCTLEFPAADSKSLFDAAFRLYLDCREQKPIRSLGIRCERLSQEGAVQTSLFGGEEKSHRREKLERTVDALQMRGHRVAFADLYNPQRAYAEKE